MASDPKYSGNQILVFAVIDNPPEAPAFQQLKQYALDAKALEGCHQFLFSPTSRGVCDWRELYDRGHRIKTGQLSHGTGTTPTLKGTDYVTITDNADPQMHVNVYLRAKTVAGSRLVCSVPVFQPGQSADESSLIAAHRSIIVSN